MERFKIKEQESGRVFYGCNQDWYSKSRQRRAGCGPSSFSNILLYLFHDEYKDTAHVPKEDAMQLMEEIWQYITPTLLGVFSTEIFVQGALEYTEKNRIPLDYAVLNIAGEGYLRPSLEEIVRFIESGLNKGVPIAFLNLCSGQAKNIDRWHWMTVVSLEKNEDGNEMKLGFVDNGEIRETDLKVWYETTTMGGGLVYFVRRSAVEN